MTVSLLLISADAISGFIWSLFYSSASFFSPNSPALVQLTPSSLLRHLLSFVSLALQTDRHSYKYSQLSPVVDLPSFSQHLAVLFPADFFYSPDTKTLRRKQTAPHRLPLTALLQPSSVSAPDRRQLILVSLSALFQLLTPVFLRLLVPFYSPCNCFGHSFLTAPYFVISLILLLFYFPVSSPFVFPLLDRIFSPPSLLAPISLHDIVALQHKYGKANHSVWLFPKHPARHRQYT